MKLLNIENFLISLIRPFYHLISYHWKKPLIRGNAILKDKYLGKSCVIICSGSSLKNIDLVKLSGLGDLFGCNFLFKNEQFSDVKFRAYFDLDSARPMRGRENPEENAEVYFRLLDRFLKGSSAFLFFSAENDSFFRKRSLFVGENLRFIKCYQKMNDARVLTNDLAGKFTFSDGAAYGMVACAIYMGYKSIYLSGCDYTFSPQQIGHFYEDWTKLSDVPVDGRHTKLQEFAKSKGVRIVNLVPEGFESPVYELARPSSLGIVKDGGLV